MNSSGQDVQDANQKPLELLEGSTLPSGNYRLLKRIASTNMSVVYHAYDNATKRPVAVKILANDRYAARFKNEANLTYGLTHSNIATTIRYNLDGEPLPNGVIVRYLVMKYLDGLSLSETMRRNAENGTPPANTLATARELVLKFAPAMDYLHQQRIVHRDIKPSNILYDKTEPYLIDFGIAKLVPLEGVSNVGDEMTQVEERPGTSMYMPPEQWLGASVDGRSDQYAFAITLYMLLSNRISPFQRAVDSIPETRDNGVMTTDFVTQQAWQRAHLFERPTPLREYNPAVPAAVWQVLMRGMEKDNPNRFPDILQFAAAFEGALSQLPTRSATLSSAIYEEATSVDLPAYRPLEDALAAPVSPPSRNALKETTNEIDKEALQAASVLVPSAERVKIPDKTPHHESGKDTIPDRSDRKRSFLLPLVLFVGLLGAAAIAFLILRPSDENALALITLTPSNVAEIAQAATPSAITDGVVTNGSTPISTNTPTDTLTPASVSLPPTDSALAPTTEPIIAVPNILPTTTWTPSLTYTATATELPTSTLTNTPTVAAALPRNTATTLPILLPTDTTFPSDTPTATLTPSYTPTLTSPPSDTPTATATLTNTVLPSDTPTNTPLPTVTQIPTDTALPTAAPTDIPTTTQVPTATQAPTNTAVPTAAPTDIPTTTQIPTDTALPTAAPTDIPTTMQVPTDTTVPTATPTNIPTTTQIPTDTALPTAAPTDIPTTTQVPTNSAVPTAAPTDLPTATQTPTNTASPSRTPLPTATPTKFIPSETPTITPDFGATAMEETRIASNAAMAPTLTYFSALLTLTAIAPPTETPTPLIPTSSPTQTATVTVSPSPTLTPTPTFTPTPEIIVRADGDPNIPMRGAPNGSIVRPLPTDVLLEVLSVSADGNWLDVQLPNGLTGWVPVSAVKNVRVAPAPRAEVVARISSGTTVQITGDVVDDEWYPVRLPDGTEGWMSGQVLDYSTPTPVVTPTPTPTAGTPGVFRPRPTVNWTNGTALRIVTTSQTVWLRSRPLSSDANYTTVANNNPVTATGQNSYDGRQWWWQVRTEFGAVGWIEQGQLVQR